MPIEKEKTEMSDKQAKKHIEKDSSAEEADNDNDDDDWSFDEDDER